jgi:hypothetical protein
LSEVPSIREEGETEDHVDSSGIPNFGFGCDLVGCDSHAYGKVVQAELSIRVFISRNRI